MPRIMIDPELFPELDELLAERDCLKSELRAAYCKIDALEQQLYGKAKLLAEKNQEVHRLQSDLAKMREALRMVEWTMDPEGPRCPWCGGHDRLCKGYALRGGHTPDCPRQAALGEQK